MLVLNRRNQESIFIDLPTGETMEFKILHLTGRQATVGIDGPRTVNIRRGKSTTIREDGNNKEQCFFVPSGQSISTSQREIDDTRNTGAH